MKEWKIFRHKSLMPLCTLKKNPNWIRTLCVEKQLLLAVWLIILHWEINWYFSSKFIKSYDWRYNVLSVLARWKNHLILSGEGRRNITDIFSSVRLVSNMENIDFALLFTNQWHRSFVCSVQREPTEKSGPCETRLCKVTHVLNNLSHRPSPLAVQNHEMQPHVWQVIFQSEKRTIKGGQIWF